jgi:hypothetical protein
LSTRRSIDAFMSVELSRARRTGPFVHTVASATWFAAMDGFFSIASSTSSRASSFRCFSSFPSFSWA